MSKDRIPQVGDVWISTKTNKKIYITGLGNHVYVVSDSGVASSRWYCDFNKLYTYLGKSKANINDLFKTENIND